MEGVGQGMEGAGRGMEGDRREMADAEGGRGCGVTDTG